MKQKKKTKPRLQSRSFRKYGVPLYGLYSPIHPDPEWYDLLESLLWVKKNYLIIFYIWNHLTVKTNELFIKKYFTY